MARCQLPASSFNLDNVPKRCYIKRMSIPFKQYLRPDGRKTDISIDRSPEIEELARQVVAKGGRFEAEVLTTGHVSFEVVRDGEVRGEVESVAAEICANGPPVHGAVDKLVRDAHEALCMSHEEQEAEEARILDGRRAAEDQRYANALGGLRPEAYGLLGICPKCGSEENGHDVEHCEG